MFLFSFHFRVDEEKYLKNDRFHSTPVDARA